ncbi:twin-arginine translocation pathway signal [Aquincola sp. S2]|uniref:Twin-arginine translocation pathway signal n=1 Tax=Pseudaquabacterium terrae TaxID=2732868 RepID=A0ABX2EFB1_9BURK|nr:YSC84-related protein [Aquabacterium terrae]NRF67308.1 twin-arginine translocation pathway signal [Aquabacterium terrae]
MNIKTGLTSIAVVISALAAGCTTTANVTSAPTPSAAVGLSPLSAEQRRDLAEGYTDSLNRLYATAPRSRELVDGAVGVLVFPRAMSAGLVVGGEIGNGELRVKGRHAGYYRTTSASVGLQAGAQSKALVFLFMSDESLRRFQDSKGWSIGADASVALLKIGANGEIDINSARAPIVAFAMTNMGLMANLSLEGTKITRIG